MLWECDWAISGGFLTYAVVIYWKYVIFNIIIISTNLYKYSWHNNSLILVSANTVTTTGTWFMDPDVNMYTFITGLLENIIICTFKCCILGNIFGIICFFNILSWEWLNIWSDDEKIFSQSYITLGDFLIMILYGIHGKVLYMDKM